MLFPSFFLIMEASFEVSMPPMVRILAGCAAPFAMGLPPRFLTGRGPVEALGLILTFMVKGVISI